MVSKNIVNNNNNFKSLGLKGGRWLKTAEEMPKKNGYR